MEIRSTCAVSSNLPISVKTTAITAVSAGIIKTPDRYRLTEEEILDCCKNGYELGFRTFVLQGGEDPYFTDEKIVDIVKKIRNRLSRLCHHSFHWRKKTRKATAFTKKQEQTGICCVMKLQMKTITAIYIRNR